MKLAPPEFLKNLYRDLRDRRLLLPVVLLAVGLVAVPVLLTSKAETSTPPTAGSKESGSAAVPAVVAQELGVTNYRKRLDRLQSKDPFHQPFAAAPKLSERVKNASITNASIPSSTDDGSADTSSTDIGSTSSVTGAVTSGGATTPPDTGSTSSGSGSTSPKVKVRHHKPTLRYYAWRVSVKVGEPGHLKERSEVQRLALLPSEGKPVLTFLGATEDGSAAVFLVSSDVDSVKGDGRCLPSHSLCQYVVMESGDKAHFHYAPNNTRYNLVLVDIHAVDVTDKLPRKPSGEAQPQQRLPLLGDG